MNDPADIKLRYRRFADRECKGYSDVYYGLALAVLLPALPSGPLALVEVGASAGGLDANPIRVHDDEAVRWLLACVWPDHHERRRRLEGALDLARAQPPAVSAGDLVDDLPALLDEAPDDAQLVVFHSAVLTYVSPDRRATFGETLAAASKRRDIWCLSNEAPGVISEMAALAPPLSDLRFLLGRTHFTNGRRRDELLALAHPHGADLTWL